MCVCVRVCACTCVFEGMSIIRLIGTGNGASLRDGQGVIEEEQKGTGEKQRG